MVGQITHIWAGIFGTPVHIIKGQPPATFSRRRATGWALFLALNQELGWVHNGKEWRRKGKARENAYCLGEKA